VAQKVTIILIDDLDGGEADVTVRFGLEGADYEIDLSAGHASELRDALAPFVASGRRSPGRPSRAGTRAGTGKVNPAEVRDWAKAQGMDVNDRGRVPAELMVKFRAATGR
jgi:Lsr2